MCFSTSVSFVTGVSLLAVGSYATFIANIRNKKYLLLAFMPMFFGLQQIIEGFVWLGVQNNNNPLLLKISTLGFLLFALLFWPMYAPLSIYVITDKVAIKKKRLLLVLFYLGLCVGTALYLPLAMGTTHLSTKVFCSAISYDWDIPMPLEYIYIALYLLVTILPFFVSENVGLKIFAILILLSAIIANYFYTYQRTSVWCFFAAILSIFIVYIIYRLPEK